MGERVVVRVPATVANLGSGFDCLGLALAWYNEVAVELRDEGLDVTVAGPGADTVERDERNLVARGARALLGPDAGLRINQLNAIPFGRGFGSSAAAIAAGVVAGRALAGTDHDDEQLVAIASEIEGHPDNVAPCLLGGVTVIGGARMARLDAPDLSAIACVAPSSFGTGEARAVLPDPVSRADAVSNVGRAAMLVAALAQGRTELLLAATDDSLHQPARFALMPETADLVRALRADGIAAFLSGAGPSVCALVAAGDADEARGRAAEASGPGWDCRVEGIDPGGAVVVDHLPG